MPSFTKVADSPTKNAYILGVGHGTTTSLDGKAGTGLVWTSDVEGQNLRVYNAIPSNGLMTQIAGFNIPGTTKFTRPVFGDGRVYMGTTEGYFYGFGSPVNPPLKCASPIDFGIADIDQQTKSETIVCTASIDLTITNIITNGSFNFAITGLSATPLAVTVGKSFSFQAHFSPQAVGSLSVDISITTTNSVSGYSTHTAITLLGTGQSANGLLQVSPPTLSFSPAVSGEQPGGVSQTVDFVNQGNSLLTIQSIHYSLTSDVGPCVHAIQTSSGTKIGPFTFGGLPPSILAQSTITVTVNFDTSRSGNFAAYLQIQSDGGKVNFDVVGTSGSAPIAQLEFQTTDKNGWVKYQAGKSFTFGNVTENTTRLLKMRLSNTAPSNSAKLSVTVSKPPMGVGGLIEAVNNIELAEGTSLAPGESAEASLYCTVPKAQWNGAPYKGTAHWTLNVDDPNFDKQLIKFDCLGVSEQSPPLQPDGLALYKYIGCFKDNNPGRQLQTQIYSDSLNKIAKCVAACAAKNLIFCGVQYNRECWGGSNLPNQQVDEANCNYACAGDVNQICGGNGVGPAERGTYISLFADSSRYKGNATKEELFESLDERDVDEDVCSDA